MIRVLPQRLRFPGTLGGLGLRRSSRLLRRLLGRVTFRRMATVGHDRSPDRGGAGNSPFRTILF